jgi:hypothetical protein
VASPAVTLAGQPAGGSAVLAGVSGTLPAGPAPSLLVKEPATPRAVGAVPSDPSRRRSTPSTCCFADVSGRAATLGTGFGTAAAFDAALGGDQRMGGAATLVAGRRGERSALAPEPVEEPSQERRPGMELLQGRSIGEHRDESGPSRDRRCHGGDDVRHHVQVEGGIDNLEVAGDQLSQLVEVGLALPAGQTSPAKRLALVVSPVDAPLVAATGAGRGMASGVAGAAQPAVAPGNVRWPAPVALRAGGMEHVDLLRPRRDQSPGEPVEDGQRACRPGQQHVGLSG